MKIDDIDLLKLESLPLNSVRRFLQVKGWRKRRLKNDVLPNELGAHSSSDALDFFVLESCGIPSLQLALPSNQKSPERVMRLRDVVRTLSQLEDRSPEEVLSAIFTVGFDVVRSSIPSELVFDDSIQMEMATSFVLGMKTLLASTATTEINPTPFFRRLRKNGVAYANSCRFGHTYRGSFGFTLESPLVPPAENDLFDKAPVPFERKVVMRLIQGMRLAFKAAEEGNISPIVQGVELGLSANGCEDLATLIEQVSPKGLSFGFTLSPAVPTNMPPERMEFKVAAEHAQLLQEAARELRREDFQIPVRISGRVIRLQNESDPTDLSATTGLHEIAVFWESKDLGDLSVSVDLSPEEYLAAVSAHGSGRPVYISGDLAKRGHRWKLLQPKDFRIYQQGGLDLT